MFITKPSNSVAKLLLQNSNCTFTLTNKLKTPLLATLKKKYMSAIPARDYLKDSDILKEHFLCIFNGVAVKDRRVTEWFALKGTSKDHPVEPPCHRQGHIPLDEVAQSLTLKYLLLTSFSNIQGL